MRNVGLLQVSSRLELWGDELQRAEPPRDPQQAEQALAAHNESVARMQHATYQVRPSLTRSRTSKRSMTHIQYYLTWVDVSIPLDQE